MAHGYYDYGVSRQVPTLHASPDMAEQAVRTGAVSSVDRRGNVIIYDGFEDATLKWPTAAVAGYVAKSNTLARSGDYSMYIRSGPVAGNFSQISRELTYPVASRFGSEIWFLGPKDVGRLAMYMHVSTDTDHYVPTLYYDWTTLTLSYMNAAGGRTAIETYANNPFSDTFYPMKFVYDATTFQYVRAMFFDREYDLTGIGAFRIAPGAGPYVSITITMETLKNEYADVHIDDFIFTQNEP